MIIHGINNVKVAQSLLKCQRGYITIFISYDDDYQT